MKYGKLSKRLKNNRFRNKMKHVGMLAYLTESKEEMFIFKKKILSIRKEKKAFEKTKA